MASGVYIDYFRLGIKCRGHSVIISTSQCGIVIIDTRIFKIRFNPDNRIVSGNIYIFRLYPVTIALLNLYRSPCDDNTVIFGVNTISCRIGTANRTAPNYNISILGFLDIIFVESGGDNLAATFSPELVDFSIYIIDVAEGEKIPRKAGQGMIKSDLFIINKIDLAKYVGADLDRMKSDSEMFRSDGTFLFTNLKKDEGLQDVIAWIKKNCLLEDLEEVKN